MKRFVIYELTLFCAAALAAVGTVANAQQMSPTIAEFTKKARGTILITNISDEPKIVSCGAQGFEADEHGAAHPHSLDHTLNARLSTGRVELPPKAARQISFDSTPAALPAWFLVTCRFVPMERSAGLTVAMEISSIVIIHDKQFDPADVVVSARRKGDKVDVEVKNNGSGLARVDSGEVVGHRKQADLGSFILYPHQKRLLQTDWKETVPPDAVRIQIGKKRLETPVN